MQIERFLEYLRKVKRYSSHTITAYENDLHQFYEFCGLSVDDDENEDFSRITVKTIRDWVVAELTGEATAEPLKPASVRRKLSSVKSFFRYLVIEKVIETNMAENVGGPKLPKRLPVYVEEEQMTEILDKSEWRDGFSGLRDWLLILMVYHTGLRRSEVTELKVDDIIFSRKCMRVRGKGNKVREIPITEELISDINLYLEQRKDVIKEEHGRFFVTDKGNPIYPGFVYILVSKILSEHTTLSNGSPHVLRHTFATHLLNNGASIQGIKELLGHASLAATQVYTHNSVESMLKIFKQAHPRA